MLERLINNTTTREAVTIDLNEFNIWDIFYDHIRRSTNFTFFFSSYNYKLIK